jgi:hypothetical protein
MRRLEFSIPMTPTLNVMLRWHWRERQRRAKEMAYQVRSAIGVFAGQPMRKCRILIERHSSGKPDIDGAWGGAKLLLDTLVVPTRRNPHGLGVIANDDPDCAQIELRTVKTNRAAQKTVVMIEEL